MKRKFERIIDSIKKKDKAQPELALLSQANLGQLADDLRSIGWSDKSIFVIARAVNLHAELLAAVKAAKDHLDYCNYGDKWERECAVEARLPKLLENTVKKAELP